MLVQIGYNRHQAREKQLEAWYVKTRTQHTPLAYKRQMNQVIEGLEEGIHLKVETYGINEAIPFSDVQYAKKKRLLYQALLYETLVVYYTGTPQGQVPQFLMGQVAHQTLDYPLTKPQDYRNRDEVFVCFSPSRSGLSSVFPEEELRELADYNRIKQSLNTLKRGINEGKQLETLESEFDTLEEELDKPVILLFTQSAIRERYRGSNTINTLLARVRIRHHTITMLHLVAAEDETHDHFTMKLKVGWMKNERTP